MSDADARLARKLASVVGRLDWWNVYEEHTPYEWAWQVAAWNVEPLGDDRDDMRMAVATANLMNMQAAKPISQEQFAELLNSLRGYLRVNQVEERVVGPGEAARLAGAK